MLAAGAVGFASTGLRSQAFEVGALDPVLEGRDLRVVGVVTDMPQRNESGLRFTLHSDAATFAGRAVAVPALIDVGWYSGNFSHGGDCADLQGALGNVRAGDRWSMTLRLKAPHGSRNPFGFDFEPWLWERGVQATAYARTASSDEVPLRLEQAWLHPRGSSAAKRARAHLCVS
jgi:competence protein ComEC